jgi:hypothetical protein
MLESDTSLRELLVIRSSGPWDHREGKPQHLIQFRSCGHDLAVDPAVEWARCAALKGRSPFLAVTSAPRERTVGRIRTGTLPQQM